MVECNRHIIRWLYSCMPAEACMVRRISAALVTCYARSEPCKGRWAGWAEAPMYRYMLGLLDYRRTCKVCICLPFCVC